MKGKRLFSISLLLVLFSSGVGQAGEVESIKSKSEILAEASKVFTEGRVDAKEVLDREIDKLKVIRDKAIKSANKLKDKKRAKSLVAKAHSSYLSKASLVRDSYYGKLKDLRNIYLSSSK